MILQAVNTCFSISISKSSIWRAIAIYTDTEFIVFVPPTPSYNSVSSNVNIFHFCTIQLCKLQNHFRIIITLFSAIFDTWKDQKILLSTNIKSEICSKITEKSILGGHVITFIHLDCFVSAYIQLYDLFFHF